MYILRGHFRLLFNWMIDCSQYKEKLTQATRIVKKMMDMITKKAKTMKIGKYQYLIV